MTVPNNNDHCRRRMPDSQYNVYGDTLMSTDQANDDHDNGMTFATCVMLIARIDNIDVQQ